MRRALAADVPERVGEHEPSLGVGVDDLDRLAVRGAEDVAGPERVAAGQVLGGGEGGDRAHRRAERGERADPVQRPGAAGHVALHVLHPAGRLDRDAAGVERDRLADQPEHDVVARAGRVVAEDDQARLVAAAAADGGQRAHPELVELAGGENLAGQVLVLARELLRLLAQRVRRELVRRHVREVARAVRPLGDDRGALDGRLELGVVGVADDDPLRRLRLVLRLPAAGRVGAEDRPLDERRGLLGQGNRERLVEQPDERAADAGESLGGRRARRSQRVCVHVVALADAGRHEARRLELAVQVEQDRLAAVAAQVAALAELARAVRRACRRRSSRRRRPAAAQPAEQVRPRARLSRQRDLDPRHRSAMVSLPPAPRHRLALDPEKER